MQASLPPNEADRLEALRRYDILDSPREAVFDDLVHLAALICGTPISGITLLDSDRQWFKTCVGIDLTQTPRDVSFCAHTILDDALVLVPDTRQDPRFADNPFVAGDPHVRFYAGAPLVTPEGYRIGALCVFDIQPRELSDVQQDALRRLARQAMALLEARPIVGVAGQSRRARQQAEAQRNAALHAEARRIESDLHASNLHYRRLFDVTNEGILILNAANGNVDNANPFLCRVLGYEREELVGRPIWETPAFHNIAASHEALEAWLNEERSRYDNVTLVTKSGDMIIVEFVCNAYESAGDRLILCDISDVTERRLAEAAAHESKWFLQSTLDALGSHIAVLDETGTIIAVNKAWRDFSRDNDGTSYSCEIGANYLTVCDRAQGAWAGEAPIVAQAIRDILAGQGQGLCLEYPCHSPTEERWFNVCITRFEIDGAVRIVTAHENITDRKQAEQAIWQSEQQFRAMFNNALAAIFISDDDGRFLDMNPAACSLYELSREQLLTMGVSDFMDEGWDRAGAIRNFIDAGHAEGDFRLAFPDGRKKHIEFFSTANFLPGRHLTALRDITERVKHTEAMRIGQERFDILSRATNDTIWDWDLESGTLWWNAGMQTLFGYSVEDIEPGFESWMRRIHPNDAERVIGGIQSVIENGQISWADEYRFRRADDTYAAIFDRGFVIRDDEGQPVRMIGSMQDITERKEAEKELLRMHDELEGRVFDRTAELAQANAELRKRISERQRAIEAQEASYALLRSVIEGSTDAIFVKDLQGRYLMINSAGARMRKKTVDEIIGKVDAELFSPATARVIIEADHRIMADNQTRTYEETTIEDGHTRTHLITKGPHRNPRGAVIGIIGMARDITARKRQEEALRIAKEEADIANAAKSEFLSRMSHELRTPLNAILGFGQILEMGDLPPKRRESVQHILKAGAHLLDLINEVLDISRIEAGTLSLNIEAVPVGVMVGEVLDLVRPMAAASDVHLGNQIALRSDWYMLADRQRLKQSLLNLLSNAIKYNRSGGSVMLSAEMIESERSNSATRLRLFVVDTGAGIEAADISKLFVPFERLGASQTRVEGTGIGLALTRRLVEAMQGTIGVFSTPGEGSTFWIELPLVPAYLQNGKGRDDVGNPTKNGALVLRKNLLYIEDNLANLKLVEAVLEARPNIRLITATQGSTGLDMAFEHRPDLILLDLHLPDFNGDEVLRRLQSNPVTGFIPVVIISADATAHQVEKLVSAGARSYLTKPFNVQQLLQTLDEYLKGKE